MARVFTTVITSVVWWFILYGAGYAFSGGSHVPHVAPLVMANLTAMSYVFIPYFVTQNVLTSMLDGHVKQRIIFSEPEDPNARPENPWRTAVINGLRFGLVPAIISYVVCIRAGADSLTAGQYASRFAWGGAILAGAVAWLVSGEPVLRSLRVPRDKRLYAGDPKQYLMTRYVWPHGIANAVINAALAFALSPVSISDPNALVPVANVVGDVVITCVILTWLMVSAVKSQARADIAWGIAPEAACRGADLELPSAFLPAVLLSFGFAIVVGVAFWLLKASGMNVYAWAVFRGVVYGVYCGWLCKRVAQAVINEHFHPDPAAVRIGKLAAKATPKAAPAPAPVIDP